MANLKDYISGLVASVTVARYNADVQSAEIARQYKTDDVLCNFSVPRMRIGDVEIEIPYALDHLNTQNNVIEVDKNKIYTALKTSLCKSYGIAVIPNNNPEAYTGLTEDLTNTSAEIAQGVEANGLIYLDEGANEIYYDRVDIWREYMTQLGIDQSVDKYEIINNVRERVSLAVQNQNQGGASLLESLEVIAEANELSAYDSRVITRMKIKIQEDGMVWANTANGEILVAE